MKIKNIEDMPFKDKCKIILTIVKEYNRARTYIIGIDKETLNYVRDSKSFDPDTYFKKEQISLIAMVNSVYGLLVNEEKEIIDNDFINMKEKNWWIEKYSRSTYYSIKNSAINNFTYYLLV